MKISVKLLPPSPISSRVPIDIRMAAETAAPANYELKINETPLSSGPLHSHGKWQYAEYRLDPASYTGSNILKFRVLDASANELACCEKKLEVLETGTRSTRLIDGAWCGLYHWSEAEGRLWNRELRNFTAGDWRELVQGMHDLGMDIIVIQELFRNEEYYGKHQIERNGYRGKSFYPSALVPERMSIACEDPVEEILAAADHLDMMVLPGIGMYAWFDFTPGSLNWHCRVAEEVYERYGHHKSLYGWYISEEVFGNLNYGPDTERHIVEFFRQFGALRNRLEPTMPVMLAPNCFHVPASLDAWNNLARELDIICPFGFHRMEASDIGAGAVIDLFQKIADENGAHLWLDMEAFLFHPDQALYPRPMDEITTELEGFQGFEKILCYQYPGLFNAPASKRKPGGPDTVQLYHDYLQYYRTSIQRSPI